MGDREEKSRLRRFLDLRRARRLLHRAEVARGAMRLDEAESLYRQVLDIADAGDGAVRKTRGEACLGLGRIARGRGQLEAAREYFG